MKIKRIYIKSFGKLQNAAFDFRENINVIYGANEAGKSTLAAFIKFMFYSLTAKIKTDNLLERERYMTFGESSIGGSVLFEYNGQEILLTREYITNARQSVSAVDNVTFAHIPELEVIEPGNIIFGVDRDTFSSTLFIRQADIKIKDSGSLGDKLQNIAGSGDEDISYKTAVEKIKNASAGLEYKTKPGKIALLQNEIMNQELMLKKAEENDAVYSSMQKTFNDNIVKIKELNGEAEGLSEKIKEISKAAQMKALRNAFEIEEKIKILQKNIGELKDTLLYEGKIYSASEIEKAKLAVLEEKRIKEQMNELEMKTESLYKTINELKGNSAEDKKQKIFPIYIVFAILTLVSAAAYFLIGKYAFAAAGAFLTATVIFAALYFRKVNKIKSGRKTEIFKAESAILQNEREYEADIALKNLLNNNYKKFADENKNILEFVANVDTEEYQKLSDTHSDLMLELEVMKKQYEALTDGIDISKYSREEIFSSEFEDAAKVQNEYEKIKNEINRYEKENSALKIMIDDFYNINQSAAQISTRLCGMREKLEYLTEYKTVYDTALECIEESKKELEKIISPKINQSASEYIKIISGGKYSRLSFDNKFNTELSEERDFLPADYISLGGRDGAYIAMRLAMIDVLYEKVPVFFDDSFCNIDRARLQNIKKVLERENECGNQIFIFTCHERERDLFGKYNVVHIA